MIVLGILLKQILQKLELELIKTMIFALLFIQFEQMLFIGPKLVFLRVLCQQMIDKSYLLRHSDDIKSETCKVLFPKHHSIVATHLQIQQ